MKYGFFPPIELNLTNDNYDKLLEIIDELYSINAITEEDCLLFKMRLMNHYIDRCVLRSTV